MERQDSEENLALSSDVLDLIAQVQAEQNLLDGNEDNDRINTKPEIWSMSQFWYTAETAEKLCDEIIQAAKSKPGPVAVACLSCPTAFEALLKRKETFTDFDLHLFEFDTRFGKNTNAYTYYNYNHPLDIPQELRNRFDIVIADPPHVSDECVVKYAQTVRLLSKSPDTYVLFCTAATLEDIMKRLFNNRLTDFHPEHNSKLGNQFCCYTNYEPKTFKWVT